MKKSILIGIALLLGTFASCSDWAGFGFDASGPEMPRLRQIMLLKPGMTVGSRSRQGSADACAGGNGRAWRTCLLDRD